MGVVWFVLFHMALTEYLIGTQLTGWAGGFKIASLKRSGDLVSIVGALNSDY